MRRREAEGEEERDRLGVECLVSGSWGNRPGLLASGADPPLPLLPLLRITTTRSPQLATPPRHAQDDQRRPQQEAVPPGATAAPRDTPPAPALQRGDAPGHAPTPAAAALVVAAGPRPGNPCPPATQVMCL